MFEKSPRVRTLPRHDGRVRPRQEFEGDSPFGVRARARCRGALQRVHDIRLRNILQPGPRRNRLRSETLSEVTPKRSPVSDEPSLHELHHQEGAIVRRSRRAGPAVPILEVPPGRMPRRHRRFAVHQEDRDSFGVLLLYGRGETPIGLVAGSASNHFRQPAAQAGGLEERTPRLPEPEGVPLALSAAFDVEGGLHQRFPPNSPEIHSSPSP